MRAIVVVNQSIIERPALQDKLSTRLSRFRPDLGQGPMSSIALIVTLGLASVSGGETGPDKPPETARFVLGVNRDESLTLDGKSVTREQLAREWPRLAGQVREKARTAGEA